MLARFTRSILSTFGTVIAVSILWSAVTPVAAQNLPLYKASRTPDGQPDLGGFWQAFNTANWDIEDHEAKPAPYEHLVGAYLAQPPGFGVVEGGAIPYTPEALAKRNLRFKNRLQHDPLFYGGPTGTEDDLSDPEAKCFQGGGLVRATYMPYPFQILQATKKILIAYQFGGAAFRVVHMVADDDLDKAIDDYTLENDAWLGRSSGRWDGDTLVVYTKGPYYRSVVLDRAGNFMSQNARVEERFTPISPYHLSYEATITDPDTFTRPWKIRMPLYRNIEPKMQLLEFQCLPFVEEFMYGTLKRKDQKQYPEGFNIR